jgi:hypothetical protein
LRTRLPEAETTYSRTLGERLEAGGVSAAAVVVKYGVAAPIATSRIFTFRPPETRTT